MPIYYGSSQVNTLYTGATAIQKVFYGTTQIYPALTTYEWSFISEGSSDPDADNYVYNDSVTNATQALAYLNATYPPTAGLHGLYFAVCPSDDSYFWVFYCYQVEL